MLIHSDILSTVDIMRAVRHASIVTGSIVTTERADRRGSRQRSHALDVLLSADGKLSKRRRNPGASRDRSVQHEGYAPTRAQWGHVLAWIFEVDPRAIAVGQYNGAAEFHARTIGEYEISHGPACVSCRHECPRQRTRPEPLGSPFCPTCDDHAEAVHAGYGPTACECGDNHDA